MDESYALMRRMILAINKTDGAYYYFARQLGANENELTLLYALDDGEAHTQKEICDEWLMPRTTANSIVKKLEAAGYVTLAAASRGREKEIILTEKGRQYAESLLGPLYSAEEAAIKDTLQNYSPEFVEAIEHFSAKFGGYYSAFRRQLNGEAEKQ